MRRVLPIVVFLFLVVASGVIHGMRTERWSQYAGMDEAARRLDVVPKSFGDWRGEDNPLQVEDLKRVGVRGHLSRNYHNQRTGDTVRVLLVCGRPGPISVHTPDICYEGAGYGSLGDPQIQTFHLDQPLRFWALRFRKPNSLSSTQAQLQIYWAWNTGDGWVAPDNPRMAFSRYPILYKLYVIRTLALMDKPGGIDPCERFVQDFIRELDRVIVPNAAGI